MINKKPTQKQIIENLQKQVSEYALQLERHRGDKGYFLKVLSDQDKAIENWRRTVYILAAINLAVAAVPLIYALI